MTFQGDGPLDTGGVSGGGGGRGGRVAIGGGAGLVVVVIAALVFGINPADILGGGGGDYSTGDVGAEGSGAGQIDDQIKSCTIEKANTDTVCRIVATTNSLGDVWPQLMSDYTEPQTVIFSGSVDTGCGSATSAVGPFYCPSDQTAYFDPSFFDTLERQLGGSDGPLAQEYVVAHEFGHHVQHVQGLDEKAQQMGSKGAKSGSVRLELQADCYAGVWANRADDGKDAMLEPITDQQISDVITTARAIGDDKLSGGSSDGWTHGSSSQRVRWFSIGYQSGEVKRCDTFSTDDL
ncbi:KPN_02809 family neutral zinc metallopeptidase [Microlunatus soli]|uniref:Neutral zinc metallopeptidase n=1 Tax=Microlunatus soli TaxID=630515 RepID=A0A1H1WSP2_9ACTN|nr:neutral zinc metallopeptidase [Microlunatus soli]SDT00193.1 hypothetical protein SAMN04489812_3789 [Microlunatus soli]